MVRTAPTRLVAAGLAGAAALMLTLSACGEKKDDTSTPAGGNGSALPSVAADSALAAKVPAALKADGKLVIGVDATYAPSEYLDADGKTVIGFDVDLFNAVATKLGLKTDWQISKFDDIIPGVMSGKYEVGVSSFTINPDRAKQVQMVSYYTVGTQWVAKPGSTIVPTEACGKKIAVQTGTVQDDDIAAKDKACTAAGKPAINVDRYQAQSDATTAVISGKDDAMLADFPVSAYAVKETKGQLALLGSVYDTASYGYVVSNDQKAMAEVLRDATKAIIADGTYKAILDHWGVAGGALTTAPAINA